MTHAMLSLVRIRQTRYRPGSEAPDQLTQAESEDVHETEVWRMTEYERVDRDSSTGQQSHIVISSTVEVRHAVDPAQLHQVARGPGQAAHINIVTKVELSNAGSSCLVTLSDQLPLNQRQNS